jgi:hypothetical protein
MPSLSVHCKQHHKTSANAVGSSASSTGIIKRRISSLIKVEAFAAVTGQNFPSFAPLVAEH